MNLHIEPREGNALAFYLDGDLQFDTRDERLYHESLVLPTLSLSRPRRVLICGGGDGLALREVLRFPGVESVDLVDWSAETLDLARTTFAPYNENALADPRVSVHTGDAWAFLEARPDSQWDAILCDFTVPRTADEARVYSKEWFARLRAALTESGVVGINACSPQRVPEAFACLVHTVAAAGLSPVPFRACITSFFEQGYGIWGFILAGRQRLRRRDLKNLSCPIPTQQAELSRLWHAAKFTPAERQRFALAPVQTLAQSHYVPLLLNPGGMPSTGAEPLFERLLRAIPLLHPHHTRTMVESMAEQVVGTIHTLDLKRLTDELLARSHRLPSRLRAELEALRVHLLRPFLRLDIWATRLFATLLLILTLANIVAPDNAYGKGSSGLGHASVSRGLGSFGRGSFGKGASGFSSTTRSAGSFTKGPSGFASSSRPKGGSFSSGNIKPGTFAPEAPISGNGFRHTWRQQTPTDVFGQTYRTRTFYYSYHSYGYRSGVGSGAGQPEPQRQPARFVADDDMLVLENGDVVLTLADTVFLVVSQGTVTLHKDGTPEPLLSLYADPTLFENIAARLRDQRTALDAEIRQREEWLAWVGWTKVVVPSVKEDTEEVASLKELQRRLLLAVERIGQPSSQTAPGLSANDQLDAVELCTGIGLLRDDRIAVLGADGQWSYYSPGAVPANLKPVFAAIGAKLVKETESDIRGWQEELKTLASDKAALESDLQEYNSLASQYGSSYEVDYGSATMTASAAIDRTNKDIADNTRANEEALREMGRLQRQLVSLTALKP